MLALSSHPLAVRIAQRLPSSIRQVYRICAADEVTSTNTLLKEAASDAIRAGEDICPTVLLARRQSGGRGRLGRSFHSPDGTGLYMSVLLTPDLPPADAARLTTAAAVAAADAVDAVREAYAHQNHGLCGIKWVNDLYLGDKKCCGILAEAALTPTADAFAYAVIGIGINLLPPTNGFPEDIADSACALFDQSDKIDTDDLLARLCAGILCRLTEALAPENKNDVLSAYRRRSILDGRAVTVRPASSLGGEEIPATVLGIDDDFGLIVRYEDGCVAHLSSGEVVLCGDGGASAVQSARASVHLS
ncbi:MAG: biotin--[Clostridia bacterium]|nr:biotin--[acetyl-CoA-carboxylase] ligase [Clostridia bacterium]